MRSNIVLFALFAFGLVAQPVMAQSQSILPHVANGQFPGGSFRTTFVLVNNTDSTATATMRLTRDNGDPLEVTIPEFGTRSTFTLTLAPGATRILQTDGRGLLVTGAATVSSTSGIGVSAIFAVFDPGGELAAESGIGSASLARDFVIPVDSTETYNTGIALHAPEGGTATLTLIGADGRTAGTSTLNLAGNAHVARFVTELFPSASGFRGTLAIRSSAPVAAMGLRQNQAADALSYASLPVSARSSTQLVFNLPQIANGSFAGGRFKTSILLFNHSTSQASVTVSFNRDDGSPFVVTIPGLGSSSTSTLQIPSGGAVSLQTDGSGPLAAGAATISSNVPIGVSAVLTVLDPQGNFLSETGVGDSPSMSDFTFPVDETGTFNTAIALYNPSTSPAALTLRLMDADGAVVGATQVNFPPKSHTARFASSLFPGTGNFRGSIAVAGSGNVAATVLRQNLRAGTPVYATLPVTAGVSQGTVPASGSMLPARKTVTGVAAGSDTTLNQTLAGGFKLTGTVNLTGRFEFAYVFAQSGENQFSAEVDALTRKYSIIVPSGFYTLKACYGIPTGLDPWTTSVERTMNAGSVQISSDTTRDITLPAVDVFTVSGTVTGLDRLPGFGGGMIGFLSADNTIEGYFPLDAGGSWQGRLPAGTFSASISGAGTTLYNIGPLTVSGAPATGHFAVSETAQISGSVTPLTGGGPSLTGGPFGLVVTASSPSIQATAWDDSASALAGHGGTYRMLVARNKTYRVSVSTIHPFSNSAYNYLVFSPAAGNEVKVAGDVIFDLVIPALPAMVTLSGRITNPSGLPAAGASVLAISDSITGAPGVTFAAGARADDNGNYSVSVLSGTKYRITFEPPPQKP